MRAFTYVRAQDASDAVGRFRPGTAYLGGGTNLVDLMRLGVATPDQVVDVTRLPYDQVQPTADGGLRIGATVRNSDLAAHPLVRAHYYHPQMLGSWSIKAVLPAAVPRLSYADLGEVADGLAAQRAYLEAIDPGASPERRQALHEKLTAYCRLDTLALVELLATLCGGTSAADAPA